MKTKIVLQALYHNVCIFRLRFLIMDQESWIVRQLFEKNIFQIGEFKLKSGDLSPFYIDLRLIPSYPDLYAKVIDVYNKLLEDLEYKPDALAGLISGAIPYTSGMCLSSNIPMIQIRKKSKDYGRKRLIEGVIKEDSRVVVVDDLISTGSSKMEAISILRENKVVVDDIIVLVDRRPTAELDEAILGAKVHSAFNLNKMLELLRLQIPPDHPSFDELTKAIDEWD